MRLIALELHTIQLPHLPAAGPQTELPCKIAQTWAEKLNVAVDAQDISAVTSLLYEDCWWRDRLALTWDFRTIQGRARVTKHLDENLFRSEIRNIQVRLDGGFPPSLSTVTEGFYWVQAIFDFETKVGSGSGVIRLIQNQDGEWKAYAVSTSLESLNGHEERTGLARPSGANNSLAGGSMGGNWYERRQKQTEFERDNPTVLIVGAGHSGLNVAARLQNFGVTSLIIDKNARIGDNWRNRYKTLVTHDPVHFCHMPYLPFPSNWPLFTPKDKLGDWFESYASIMELNVWTNTALISTVYDDKSKIWTVELQRGEAKRTLSPKHIIFCTGLAGEPRVPSFPNQASFKGQVYHGSQHQDALSFGDLNGKKVIVVGTGNSGHDIAQNFYENGAEVTMLQRRGTYVLSAKTGLFMLHEGMYEEGGPSTEEADLVGHSLPIPVQFALMIGTTKKIKEAEKDALEGLERAGFKLDYCADGAGIHRKFLTRGGGYYIDIGCSQLIIDGKIKVLQSPDGIQGFNETELLLSDGRALQADIVVLATGYDNMRTTVRKVMGDRVADRCKDVWDLDAEGEVNAMWRNSGHPRFWYMGGSLALARIYSQFLALQIKAIEEDLMEES